MRGAARAARSGEFRGEAPASRRSIPSVPSVPSVPDTAATKAPTQGNDGDGYEVFVKYLPHSSEERDVAEFFSQFGPLRGGVRLLRHPATGQCKGAGFVTFAAEHSRDAALAKDGVKFGGRHLSITVAKTGTFGVRGTDQAAGTHTPRCCPRRFARSSRRIRTERTSTERSVEGGTRAGYCPRSVQKGGCTPSTWTPRCVARFAKFLDPSRFVVSSFRLRPPSFVSARSRRLGSRRAPRWGGRDEKKHRA